MTKILLPKTKAKIKPSTRSQQEALSVSTDFTEFASQCRILSGKRVIPFKLYDYQIELSRLLDTYRGVVCFKTRQLGITEVLACKFLHKACLNNAYKAAVLSIGQSETSEVCLRIRSMPSQIRQVSFSTNSLTTLTIAHGGRVLFRPSTPNSLRSLASVSDILYDEAAFPKEIREIYAGATPSQDMVGDDARTAIVSTMSEEGKLSWFWEMFESSNGDVDVESRIAKVKDGTAPPFDYWVDENGWCKVLAHWKAHPVYSNIPNYLEKVKNEKKINDAKLQREYNLGIPESGGSLFVEFFINLCAVGQWRSPNRTRKYIAGVDPNFGGDDFYVCQVWDITVKPYNIVAEYRANNRSNEYNEEKTLELLDAYNPIITAVEKNSGGTIVLENLIKKRPKLRFEPVLTTATTKRINTDRLALALEFKEVGYPKEWEGVQEMRKFSMLTRSATSGHDDCISAWAAAWVWLDEALNEGNKINSIRALFKG